MTGIRTAASQLKSLLAPACERIEIAGSIRRGKSDPKDIELVALPRLYEVTERVDMFQERTVVKSALDSLLEDYQSEWGLTLDPDHNRDGERYKRRLFMGHKVDLFIVLPPAQWGLVYFIRTGPAEYVTRALAAWKSITGGGYSRDGALHGSNGAVWHTAEETDVFRAIGWDYAEPERRTA